MTGSAATVDTIRAGLTDLAQAVLLAKRSVARTDFVDLAGLETKVEALCGAIATLPKPEARTLEPQLVLLIDELAHLTDSLVGQRDKLAGQIAESGPHRTATAAYRRQQD
ncbi:MAG: hypothetical protein ACTS3R_15330 [Inquilinaceae bacterium]